MHLCPILTTLTLAAIIVRCSHLTDEGLKRPNSIIVFADAHGWGDLGTFGATDFKMPRIDQMAGESMFT